MINIEGFYMKKILTILSCAIFASGAFATAGNPGRIYLERQRLLHSNPSPVQVVNPQRGGGNKVIPSTPLRPVIRPEPIFPVNAKDVTKQQYQQLIAKEKAGTLTSSQKILLENYRKIH